MGDFKAVGNSKFENVVITGMFERQPRPLEVIFTVKFSVVVRDGAIQFDDDNFEQYLRKKLGLYYLERELLSKTWPSGWSFQPWNTRYTYEHSWQAIAKKQASCKFKPCQLGIDIVLTAPENLRTDPKQLKEDFEVVSQQIAELKSFRPTEYLDFYGR